MGRPQGKGKLALTEITGNLFVITICEGELAPTIRIDTPKDQTRREGILHQQQPDSCGERCS